MKTLEANTVKEWNMESLSEANMASEILRIGKSLYQAILVKSLDILSEEEEKELDSLLDIDSTTTTDVLKFLKSKIPTFDLLVKEERGKLKSRPALTDNF
mgnify:CR=1 FL=1